MQLSFEIDSLMDKERGATVFALNNTPTVSSQVNKETQLEELNLNWSEENLPERERTKHVHRLHPYLGKYIPQLAEVFLRKYFNPGETVLDPFCGSGTTMVQANELGINSIGCDVSVFNTILCRAKTTKYNLSAVRKEVLDILDRVIHSAQQNTETPLLWDEGLLSNSNVVTNHPYLDQWFAPSALRELIEYRNLIVEYQHQDLLSVILSRSARSARLTTHFDLDFPKTPQTKPYKCYKHSRICSPTTDALHFLKRYSLDTLKRIEEFSSKRSEARVEVHHTDSRETDFSLIDGVITSPPYVGLIDYHEQHAYAYHLLGLEDRRQKEIGAATRGTSRKACRLYQEDIANTFKAVCRGIKSGGRLIVVAADKARLYDDIAEMVGVEVEAVVTRHVNRRTGRRVGDFYESIFIWRKS